MAKHALLIVLLLASFGLVSIGRAQDDRSYTFTDDTTIELPVGWTVDADPFSRDILNLSRDEFSIVVVMATAELQSTLDLQGDVVGLMARVFVAQEPDLEVDRALIQQVAVENEATVFIYEFAGEERVKRIYATVLSNDSVLLMYSADVNTLVDLATFRMYSSVSRSLVVENPVLGFELSSNPDIVVDAGLDDDPIFEANALEFPDLSIAEVVSYTFTDDTILRIPADWTFEESTTSRDVVLMAFDVALIFADLYRPTDLEQLELDSVEAVMDFSYVPYSDDFAFEADALTVAMPGDSDTEITYRRYQDGGFFGTQLAAQLANGSILMLDCFDAPPNDSIEATCFAMLLDAAGDDSMLTMALAAEPE